MGLPYTPLSSADTTTMIQQFAYHAVFDSLTNWNIGVFDPRAVISYTGNDTGGVFNFSSSNSTNYSNASWYLGPNDSANALTCTHAFMDTGTYTVRLIVYDPCGLRDTAYQTITIQKVLTSVESIGLNPAFVFPNPASNTVHINVPQLNGPGNLQMFSSDGRMVYKTLLEKNQNTIDLSSLPSGVYQIQIASGSQLFRNRLVKL